MRKKLKTIHIGDKEYPYKIDIYVLEEIQEKYGSIEQFELDLRGLILHVDKEGKAILNEENKRQYASKEPSIKAINFILPLMIREGLEIDNKKTDKLEVKDIMRNMEISYEWLSEIIHEEFLRCFKLKKPEPTEEVKKEKKFQ